MEFAAAFARERDIVANAVIVAPAAPDFSSPASVALPGSRSPRDGAGGPQRPEARPGLPAQAVRGHSTSTTALRTPGLATPSRAAVTGATSSRRPEPAGLADPEPSMPGRGSEVARSPVVTSAASRERRTCAYGERVDGGPGSQSPVVCGSGVARPADLPAERSPLASGWSRERATRLTECLPLLTGHLTPISAQTPHATTAVTAPNFASAPRQLDRPSSHPLSHQPPRRSRPAPA